MIERRKTGLIRQVALLFAVGIIITGVLTFFSQRYLSETAVKRQTEVLAGAVADEVSLSVREYAAYRWLLRYWCSHSDSMEIEYDAEYVPGTETERKSRVLTARHPGLMLKYASEAEIEALPERDQKLYAEIVYSWLITRVNQIKQTYRIDYLFCVMTDDDFRTQFFVFSAADKGWEKVGNGVPRKPVIRIIYPDLTNIAIIPEEHGNAVWQYILQEKIALPSLYYTHERDVFERDGVWLAHYPFMQLKPNETVVRKRVRCRTIGDITCTGLTVSEANSLEEIIDEIATSRVTERGGRADDKRSETAMEDRKKSGYF